MNKQETYFIFGYGSLLNDESRLRSAPNSAVVERHAILEGHQRVFNVAYGEHVYANVRPNVDYDVIGTIMEVTPEGFEQLQERERNYEVVDISDRLAGDWSQSVYAFIGTDNTQGSETVKQSYLDLCLSGVSQDNRERWLEETIMPFPIQKTA